MSNPQITEPPFLTREEEAAQAASIAAAAPVIPASLDAITEHVSGPAPVVAPVQPPQPPQPQPYVGEVAPVEGGILIRVTAQFGRGAKDYGTGDQCLFSLSTEQTFTDLSMNEAYEVMHSIGEAQAEVARLLANDMIPPKAAAPVAPAMPAAPLLGGPPPQAVRGAPPPQAQFQQPQGQFQQPQGQFQQPQAQFPQGGRGGNFNQGHQAPGQPLDPAQAGIDMGLYEQMNTYAAGVGERISIVWRPEGCGAVLVNGKTSWWATWMLFPQDFEVVGAPNAKRYGGSAPDATHRYAKKQDGKPQALWSNTQYADVFTSWALSALSALG